MRVEAQRTGLSTELRERKERAESLASIFLIKKGFFKEKI